MFSFLFFLFSFSFFSLFYFFAFDLRQKKKGCKICLGKTAQIEGFRRVKPVGVFFSLFLLVSNSTTQRRRRKATPRNRKEEKRSPTLRRGTRAAPSKPKEGGEGRQQHAEREGKTQHHPKKEAKQHHPTEALCPCTFPRAHCCARCKFA